MEERQPYVGRSLRMFLSYSSEDKHLAGALKNKLEFYGVEVFLAHEDISPSLEWQDIIFTSLKQCDVFLPLLTTSFKKSLWTDQETGIAVSDRKMIIPLKVDVDPYGFISRYQAFVLKFKKSQNVDGSFHYDLLEIPGEIIGLISDKDDFRENIKDCLIRAFCKSGSFDTANKLTKLVEKYDSFTPDQVKELISAGISNNQVYSSFEGRPFLIKLAGKYPELITPEESLELHQNL